MLFLLHIILFLIPSPTLLSHSASVPSESQPVKMVISEQCVSDPNEVQGREVDLIPGSPIVLTHRIHLVPGSASGSCCQSEFGALRERIEGLEREVSDLRQKCGGVDGGCCTSQQSKGLGCTTATDECLNACSDQGRCVDGKCVCFPGFSGPDCSVPDCPGNCSKKGKCVNGKCVCDQGPDCAERSCPNNCSNKGRCVNGKCVCDTGFAGPDCAESECKDGFTGPDCTTALIAVSHLGARNITESSVTLFWTSPIVQYNTYHITFTSEPHQQAVNTKRQDDLEKDPDSESKLYLSIYVRRVPVIYALQKESDQKITAKVNGRLISYNQVGLAPGQRYTVTIVGEKDGKMGSKSMTTFQTLISGPKNLQVVKTSTTSVIVQWEEAQGEIDRYILSISPNQTDGSGKSSQEMKLPPGRDSAQIDGLEPGRLYDISLVAVKDDTQSLPANVQATPGINAGLPDPASRTTRGSGGKLANLRLKNTTMGSSSQFQPNIDSSREQDPELSRHFVEPTVTTERNLTAYGHRENVQNQNLRSKYILRRKDGTIVRFQPKLHTQIKPNFTSIHSGLKEAEAKVVKDAKESVNLTTDRHTAESYYEPKTAAVNTEVGNDNILPSVTNRGQDANRDHLVSRVTKDQDPLSNTNREDSTTIKPFNNQNGPSETFSGEKNVPNQNLSPTFTQSNSGRFQPKLHDQIKLNSSTIQSGLIATEVRAEKGSKESTAFTVPAVGVASEGDTEFNSTGQNPNITTKFTMRKNNGTVFRHKLKPKLKPILHGDPKLSTESNSTKITSPQNTINHNSRPNISLQRKTGTIVRLPPKVFPQLRPESTTIHDVTGRSKNSTEDPKLGWSTKGPLSTDKATSQRNTTFPPLSEDNINHVKIQNVTSKGFIIIWVAPEGRFKNFVIRIIEEIDEEVNEGVGSKQEERKDRTEGNEISANFIEVVRRNSSIDEVRKKFIKLLPGSARLYPVTDLTSQTNYSVTLYGTGPGLRSNIHTFIITTGPEPPSHLSFTDITDTSLTVSWRRPKSSVSGFKVTYIHTKEGEPISVMVDSSSSTLSLTKLSPGSPYEVNVISVLGLDESDAIKDMVITMPDPPTDLRAINITDTKALLVWRPALATVDQYIITYRSEEAPGSELSIRVSGNAVEQQLQTLKSSAKYSVNIVSRLGDQKSSSTHTTFITASGSPGKGEPPRDLTAKHVTARTALLSWKPPASAVTSYKLTYFTKVGERKEVTLNPGVAEHKLRGLRPSSTYTALLQGERGGVYTAAISTDFTTGTLRFPNPSDCSQELLNGELDSGLVEIFPGKDGKPVMVYCDMETDGGGWTVFQRRKDGKTNFFRGWQEYRKGFGDLEGEFWLGNDFLHILTTMMPMTMRVDLRSENEAVFAHYSTFSVDTMKKHYMLRLSGYSGTAGDSLRYHDKRPFSTHDRDPQPFITRCAMSYRGGWWYKNCHEANLNGLYNTHTNHQGVIWTAWKGKTYSIPFTEMKLRPASVKSHSQG
ncbi:tenascin isoform X1 [Tachysurus ichikawai]